MNIPIEYKLLSDSFLKILFEKITLDNCIISQQLVELNKKPFKENTSIRNITLRNNGFISYCPKGKNPIINNGKWEKSNRQESKVGKIISALSLKDISSQNTESFIYFINSQYHKGVFKIVRGNDILLWYDEDKYEGNTKTGILGNSCMRYESCKDFFEIYTENNNICKMLIYVSEQNLLLGRALLWKTTCKIKIMDRVYSNQSVELLFNKWAKKNKYLLKKETLVEKFTISTKHNDFTYYPYMDTFFQIYDNEITNFYRQDNWSDFVGIAQGTNGYLEDDDNYSTCYISDERHHTDDMAYIESIEYWVLQRYATYDDFDEMDILMEDAIDVYKNRTISKNRIEHYNLIWVEEEDIYAEQDQVTYCEYSEKYFISETTEFLHNEKGVTINAIYKNDAIDFFAA
jgi:hypothetical protein